MTIRELNEGYYSKVKGTVEPVRVRMDRAWYEFYLNFLWGCQRTPPLQREDGAYLFQGAEVVLDEGITGFQFEMEADR